MKLVGNMSNQVLSTAAGKTLSRYVRVTLVDRRLHVCLTHTPVAFRMTREHAQYFSKLDVYLEVLRMLSIYHYRLTIRRFIQELFERVPFTDATLDRLDSLDGLRVDVEDTSSEDVSSGGLAGRMSVSSGEEEEDDGSVTSEMQGPPRGEDKKKVPDNRIVLQPLHVIKGF